MQTHQSLKLYGHLVPLKSIAALLRIASWGATYPARSGAYPATSTNSARHIGPRRPRHWQTVRCRPLSNSKDNDVKAWPARARASPKQAAVTIRLLPTWFRFLRRQTNGTGANPSKPLQCLEAPEVLCNPGIRCKQANPLPPWEPPVHSQRKKSTWQCMDNAWIRL